MFQVIFIDSSIFSLVLPLLLNRILDTMLRSSGLVGYGAIICFRLGFQAFKEGALITTGFVGVDKESLSLESLCSSINVVALSIFLVFIQEKDNFVEIFSSLYVVQTSDDDWKFSVLLIWNLLNFLLVGGNFDSRTSLTDKVSNHISLVLTNIFLPKQKLSVEVGGIDCIHIN